MIIKNCSKINLIANMHLRVKIRINRSNQQFPKFEVQNLFLDKQIIGHNIGHT